jgi:LPXTG-motif cell wall-anchored protein
MDPEAPRRRPRPRPPAPPEPAGAEPGEADAPPRRAPAFAVVWWAALAIVAVVVLVAFATGTADDLPWGAIIGVVVVLGFAWIALRRRAALAEEDDGPDGGEGGR